MEWLGWRQAQLVEALKVNRHLSLAIERSFDGETLSHREAFFMATSVWQIKTLSPLYTTDRYIPCSVLFAITLTELQFPPLSFMNVHL